MGRLWRLVSPTLVFPIFEERARWVRIWERLANWFDLGIVGPPANHLLGYEGVEGAQGPRFRKLSKEEIEDYLTNL